MRAFDIFVATDGCGSFTFACFIIDQLPDHLDLFDFIIEGVVKSVLHGLLLPVLLLFSLVEPGEVFFFVPQFLLISSLEPWINALQHVFLFGLVT